MNLEQDQRSVNTQPTPFGEPADVSAPYRAIGRAGAQLEDIATRFYRAKQYSAIFAARRTLQTQLGEARDKALATPDPDASEKVYADAKENAKAQAMDMGFDDFTRQRIGLTYDYVNELMQSHVNHNALEKRVSQGQADLEDSLDFNLKNAYTAGSTDLGQYKDHVDQLVDDAVKGGFVAASKASALKKQQHFQLDFNSAYHTATFGDAQKTIDMLDQRDSNGNITNWPDVTGQKRDELYAKAQHRIGAAQMGKGDVLAQIRKDGLEAGNTVTPDRLTELKKQGFSDRDLTEFQKEGDYASKAHYVLKSLAMAPASEAESIITNSGLFKPSVPGQRDDDAPYRQHAEAALRQEMALMYKDRNEDPAHFADTYLPLADGASEADKIRNRLSVAQKVGIPGMPYENQQAQQLAGVLVNPQVSDSDRLALWEKMKSDLPQGEKAQGAFWDQMHNQQKIPQLAFDLDPNDPAKNALIFRTLEAKAGGYLGKDIPEGSLKQIKNDAISDVWAIAQKQHWDDQKRALWGQAVGDLALEMKDGHKAFQTLYSEKYDDMGIPKSLPPDQRNGVGLAMIDVMNNLDKLPMAHGEMDPGMHVNAIRSDGQWDLRGNDNLFQLKDDQGNLVVKPNGVPYQFRVTDWQQFMKHDPKAAEDNAKLGFLGRMFDKKEEWTFDQKAFDKYTDNLWKQQQSASIGEAPAPYKPQVGKPALAGGPQTVKRRGNVSPTL